MLDIITVNFDNYSVQISMSVRAIHVRTVVHVLMESMDTLVIVCPDSLEQIAKLVSDLTNRTYIHL